MDPATDEQLPPPPQPPQPHRSSTSCDRHPHEHFTGFCPSCLCERLVVLDKSASASSARKSTSSAIKSLFKSSHNNNGRPSSGSSSFLPELRRTKSFSGRKNEGFLGLSGVFEPQRKSCDVRGRNSLFTLFSQDDDKRSVMASASGPVMASASGPVINPREEPADQFNEGEEQFHDSNDNGDEIEAVREEIMRSTSNSQVPEIAEEDESPKTMKDHIDLDSQNKKGGSKDLKELAGSFWTAASVFGKKLRSWTKKNNQKMMKKHNGSHTVQVRGKHNAGKNNYRDTQSEIADYGYGRRSCDTDPRLSFDVGRFSVDAGRFSVDDPRCSFDEPRASLDGYMIGRSIPRMMPPMVSVVEDAPVVICRKDAQIPVEEPRRSSVSINGDDCVPGGAAQTKDYYSDSSSRRRKSLDRSSSIRKTAAAVVADLDEIKNNGCNNIKDLNSNSRSFRDDCSDVFDLGFGDNASVIGIGERKGSKKSRRWRAWNIWGLIHRRGNAKDEEDDDRYGRTNGVERSFSGSWHDYGDPRTMLRSNSSVSWRNSCNVNGSSFGSNHGIYGRKKRDEFVLQRNPSHNDNGLRLFLTPVKGSKRGGSGKLKPPSYSQQQPFARSMLRLY